MQHISPSLMEVSAADWLVLCRLAQQSCMDLDHFKRINDSFGLLYGDEVIVRPGSRGGRRG